METGQVFYVVPAKKDENGIYEELLGESGVGLRPGLIEGYDYQLLGHEEWIEWKTREPNAVEIPRRVATRGTGARAQNFVEIYPVLAKVYYWSNGMSKPSPVQIKRGVDLHILLSGLLEVSSVKDVLWTHISSSYHDLFPDFARSADKPGCKLDNQANWTRHIRIRSKNRQDDEEWQTIDESPPTPSDSDDEDGVKSRVLDDLNLKSRVTSMDEEDYCILLIESPFKNSKDVADVRNSKFFMSEVEEGGWRAVLKVGDFVDAKDTSNTWYESRIVDTDEDKVKVHFLGWFEKWDWWISRESPTIKPLHSTCEEWRTRLSKGMMVEYCDGPIRGLKGDWIEAEIVDIQVLEEDDENDVNDGSEWPPHNPRALYTGKVIRVKLQVRSVETVVVEANSENLCKFGTHIKGKRISTESTVSVVAKQPSSSYSYSSGSYMQSNKTTLTTSNGYSSYSNRYSRPEFEGVVGLQNLGNTCFLNSIIQCLSNSKPLLEYFCRLDSNGDKYYKQEINRQNPLGMNGKIAKAFAKLLEQMWSGEVKVVTPSELKHVIGEYAPAFAGYAQQDSQEVLSFILDGIHEDLNRVLEKPYTKPIEHAGRPDVVVAREEWENYLTRNDSIITDNFMAQLRSHVTCPSCHNESITFDPYLSLSVPVPNQAWVQLTLCGIDGSNPVQYGMHVPKEGVYGDVKNALSSLSGVPSERLLLVQVKQHRIIRSYSGSMDINELVQDRDHNVVAYELEFPISRYEIRSSNLYTLSSTSALDLNQCSPGEVALCLVALQHQLPAEAISDPLENDVNGERSSNSYRHHTNLTKHRRVEWRLFGMPLLLSITRDAPCADIHEKIRHAVSHLVAPDVSVTPYKLHVSNARADTFMQKDLPEDSGEPLSPDVTRGSFTFTLEWTNLGYRDAYKDHETLRMHPSTGEGAYGNKNPSLDLRTCIAKFTEKEQLGENDTWYCPKCKNHVRAYKKFDLFSLPDILIIHLKRFRYAQSSYFMHRDKINTLVTFPITGLDMSEYLIGPTPSSSIYDLYAVSEHSGGLGGGHYTAKAKNPRNDKWYSFNDSYASETTADAAVTSQAYVLFYLRREVASPE
ncbi:unnamed protein product [Aphanomyces euteiches]